MGSELDELIRAARARYEAMSPDEKEAMHKAQRESYVRGEMSWPAPRFQMVNGVKVFESYEDYLND